MPADHHLDEHWSEFRCPAASELAPRFAPIFPQFAMPCRAWAAEGNADSKRTCMNNNLTTQITKMNRALLDITDTWPNHQDLLAGLPASPAEDLELYLAAGPWPGCTPLSEDVGPTLARAIATEVLRDARLELAVAMAVRLTFDQGVGKTERVRSLCELRPRVLIQHFRVGEALLAGTDRGLVEHIAELSVQLHRLESFNEGLQARGPASSPAGLCELRQLAGACSEMTVTLLEFHWGAEDDPFEQFFAKVVAAFPQCDFRQRGRSHCWIRQPDQQAEGKAGDQSMAA